jgi:hypothetical protein
MTRSWTRRQWPNGVTHGPGRLRLSGQGLRPPGSSRRSVQTLDVGRDVGAVDEPCRGCIGATWPSGSALGQWSQLAVLRSDESDASPVGSEDLVPSASGPTPIELIGDLETDPLVFTIKLREPVMPAQIKSLSNWAAEIGML